MKHLVVFGLLALAANPSTIFAAESMPPTAVVVKRGDAVITLADVDATLEAVPKETRGGYMDSPERIEQVLQTLLLDQQLALAARKAGMDQDPVLAARMRQAAFRVLAKAYVDRWAESLVLPDFEPLAREEYLANTERYMRPETRDVQQIFVSFEQHPLLDARARIEAAKAALDEGKSFNDVVVEFSDEKDPEKHGYGLIRHFKRQETETAFDEAAFDLAKPGDLSDIVRTSFGFHLIKLVAINAASPTPFEQVKDSIIERLRGSYVAKEREAFQSTLQAEPMTPDPAVLQHLRTRYYVEGASAPAGGAEPPASTDGEAAGAP